MEGRSSHSTKKESTTEIQVEFILKMNMIQNLYLLFKLIKSIL